MAEYQQGHPAQPPTQQFHQEVPPQHIQQQQQQQAVNQPYQPPTQMNEKPHPGPTGAAPVVGSHNHAVGNKWAFGFWDCFKPVDLCCLAYWCPCVVFGKTYDREHGEKEPSGVGLMCVAWYAVAVIGCAPCFQCWNRGETRTKYNIEGDGASDFLLACCCTCCMIIQEEKDSIVRQTGVNPVTKTAYQPIAPMGH